MTGDRDKILIWLDDLARALREGDFSAVGFLAGQADSILGHLPADAASLRRIRDAGARNAGLLTAAARGIRAARQRLQDRAHTARITTYDSLGQRSEVVAEAATLRRL